MIEEMRRRFSARRVIDLQNSEQTPSTPWNATPKALLNGLTSNIKLDRPAGKLDSFQIRNGFNEAGSGRGRICRAGRSPVKTP